MKKNGGGTDSSLGPPLGERVFWDTKNPNHECDCPGPPPQFYLPPPPRPSSLVDSYCSENSVPHLETCEAVPVSQSGIFGDQLLNKPVIDAEYHYSPTISSFVIILTVVIVAVVFLLIGTFLVALKKKKIHKFFPRKSSPQNRCDAISTNGVIYEDLTNIRSRTLSPHYFPGQTKLSSIEMIDVVSYSDGTMFSPPFVGSKSHVSDSCNSQELFNPVYEELSNGSEDRGETDSERTPHAAVSEDEFAEDELSLGKEADVSLRLSGEPENAHAREPTANDTVKDLDFSDADDKSKFLKTCEKNLNLSSEIRERGKRTSRRSFVRETFNKPKSLEKRKLWRNKEPTPLPAPPVDGSEFHEGFLIKKILQIYPDVTGLGLQCPRGPPSLPRLPRLEDHPLESGRYESLAAFGQIPSYPLKSEVFSTFGAMQSQDLSPGSDSGYGNNNSGGKSSSRARKECRLPSKSNLVLS